VKLDYRAQTLHHDGEPSPAVQFARKCNKLLEKTTISGFDPYGYAQKSLKQRRKYLKARVKIFELQRNLSLQLILCCSFREANQGEADQRGARRASDRDSANQDLTISHLQTIRQ